MGCHKAAEKFTHHTLKTKGGIAIKECGHRGLNHGARAGERTEARGEARTASAGDCQKAAAEGRARVYAPREMCPQRDVDGNRSTVPREAGSALHAGRRT